MMKRNWTDSEVERLRNLALQHLPHIEIAAALGRSLKSVRTKLQQMKNPHESLARERERQRKCAGVQNPYVRAVEDRDPVPTEEMWFARRLRMSSPFRNLTGFLQGDPRLGYSALDYTGRISA